MPDAIAVIHSSPVWLPLTQNWMFQQAVHLPSEFENHVACEWTQNLDEYALGSIHCLADRPRPQQLFDKLLRRLGIRTHLGLLPEVARRSGARILHSHFGDVGWQNHRIARRLGLAHVVSFYGQDVCMLPRREPRFRDRYRALFAHADLVLCEGPHMADCVAELGCPRSILRVQALGIDTEQIAYRPRRWDGKGPLHVLLAATFTEKKGIPTALRAIAIARETQAIELTIVGDANDEPRNAAEKGRIIETLHALELDACVRMLGYRSADELARIAEEQHVFLSPSATASTGDTEGGAPVAIIQMAAAGMPVVSTRHCDIPELIEDGVSGLLAPEGDAEAIAAHLLQLAEHPERWELMTNVARRRIERRYDVRLQAQALADHYRSLL